MNIRLAHIPYENCCTEPRQLSLFPLDVWGAERSFEVVDHPTGEISRAMIGPLPLGQPFGSGDIQCLAVTGDGAFAALMLIKQPCLESAPDFWHQVETCLAIERSRPVENHCTRWHLSSEDCLKKWVTPEFWGSIQRTHGKLPVAVHALSRLLRIHKFDTDYIFNDADRQLLEASALGLFGDQVTDAVLWVLGGLGHRLKDILTSRTGLSISLASQILSRAENYRPSAVAYALQALRTESLGVLHLIASGKPEDDAKRVQDALFNGLSMPDAFADLGVVKSTYRRTVSRPSKDDAVTLEVAANLCDLPIAGRDWLVAMRLTKEKPFKRSEDPQEFSRLLNEIYRTDFQKIETAQRLLIWSIHPGYARSCIRLRRLLSFVQQLICTANQLLGKTVTIDDAVSGVLTWLENLPGHRVSKLDFHENIELNDFGETLAGVSLISYQPVNRLMQTIFEAHPGLPNNFQMPEFFSLQALNSIDLAVLHGKACSNCLQFQSTVVNFVIEGAALYGLHTNAGIAGTVALKFDSTERIPKVEVQQVTGIKKGFTDLDLCRLAQCMAESWTKAEQEAKWAPYEDRCTHLRHLISSSMPQLSQ